ncbi:GATA transcription factor 20 [Platanthera zijinensis]|uniref:GATA transcription factor 20 n=1 Tax=Platanthera zijinensis TaxID=2320716 RepID=A0AAP0B5E4_9ASPA
MFHWCGNGSGGVSTAAAPPPSFSILFPVSGKETAADDAVDGGGGGGVTSSSSVDCTLTLGTTYTRHPPASSSSARILQRPSSASPSLCLDIMSRQGNHRTSPTKAGTAGGGNSGGNLNGDPHLLARRCANCDTTSTPLWRNGPRGPKSLCNACGIRYKKEERRAAASSPAMAVPAGGDGISYAYAMGPVATQHAWSCYAPSEGVVKSSAISVYGGEVEEPRRELYRLPPWRLNVVPSQFPPVGNFDGLSQYQ